MDNTIQRIREQAGLSRKDLCDELAIPYRTLQNWELGERTAPDYLIKLISFYLSNRK